MYYFLYYSKNTPPPPPPPPFFDCCTVSYYTLDLSQNFRRCWHSKSAQKSSKKYWVPRWHVVGAAIPAATSAVDTTESWCYRVLALIGFLPSLAGGEAGGELGRHDLLWVGSLKWHAVPAVLTGAVQLLVCELVPTPCWWACSICTQPYSLTLTTSRASTLVCPMPSLWLTPSVIQYIWSIWRPR